MAAQSPFTLRLKNFWKSVKKMLLQWTRYELLISLAEINFVGSRLGGKNVSI